MHIFIRGQIILVNHYKYLSPIGTVFSVILNVNDIFIANINPIFSKVEKIFVKKNQHKCSFEPEKLIHQKNVQKNATRGNNMYTTNYAKPKNCTA